MPAPKAGESVRASHYPRSRVYQKSGSESVTSSIVLQDDDDFSFTLEADKVYRIEVFLSASGATGGDLRLAWALGGGAAQLNGRACVGPGASTTTTADSGAVRVSAAHGLTTDLQYGLAAGANANVQETFLVETTTAGTPGTLTMRWAQWASSGTATTLTASSFIIITEVELV